MLGADFPYLIETNAKVTRFCGETAGPKTGETGGTFQVGGKVEVARPLNLLTCPAFDIVELSLHKTRQLAHR
jgi:hypothetical protein